MTKITVFHNVARECRYCSERVVEDNDGIWHSATGNYCADSPDAYLHLGGLASFGGYKAGQPLVPVFTVDWNGGAAGPHVLAEMMFSIGNAPAEYLTGSSQTVAAAYRERKLRSLSVGDVVQIGEVFMACQSVGFTEVEQPANILTEWHETTCTVLLPV